MITTIATTLQQERFCKNSVVFKTVLGNGLVLTTGQPDKTIPNMDFIRTIYLMNGAYEALGRPSKIELTIKVAE